MTSPTPQEKARALAQQRANESGKPWAVGEWPNGDSHHADHQWAYSCDIGKPCQRIDPEPAESEHKGAPGAFNIVDLEVRDDRGHAVRVTSTPPPPLTIRQRFALAALQSGLLSGFTRGDYASIGWHACALADAVLAAERGEGKG